MFDNQMPGKVCFAEHPSFSWIPVEIIEDGYSDKYILVQSIEMINEQYIRWECNRNNIVYTEQPIKWIDNLIDMPSTQIPVIAYILRNRLLDKKECLTWIGNNLVSINPYSLWGLDNLKQIPYSKKTPSLFNIASKALLTLQTGRASNGLSIIVTGSSGSGKTENVLKTFCFISSIVNKSRDKLKQSKINFSAERSKSELNTHTFTEEKLSKSFKMVNTALEAFGNACISSNCNSSRYNKIVKISFSCNSVDSSYHGTQFEHIHSTPLNTSNLKRSTSDMLTEPNLSRSSSQSCFGVILKKTPSSNNLSSINKALSKETESLSKYEPLKMTDINISCDLFERSRVSNPPQGEQNFHIFYQLLSLAYHLKDGQLSGDNSRLISLDSTSNVSCSTSVNNSVKSKIPSFFFDDSNWSQALNIISEHVSSIFFHKRPDSNINIKETRNEFLKSSLDSSQTEHSCFYCGSNHNAQQAMCSYLGRPFDAFVLFCSLYSPPQQKCPTQMKDECLKNLLDVTIPSMVEGLGLSTAEQEIAFSIPMICLLLGCITFNHNKIGSQNDNDAVLSNEEKYILSIVNNFLSRHQVNDTSLESFFLNFPSLNGSTTSPRSRTVKEAHLIKDAFSQKLFESCFGWLTTKSTYVMSSLFQMDINDKSIVGAHKTKASEIDVGSISIVDLFGFEKNTMMSYENNRNSLSSSATYGGFEHFCVNMANDFMQRVFASKTQTGNFPRESTPTPYNAALLKPIVQLTTEVPISASKPPKGTNLSYSTFSIPKAAHHITNVNKNTQSHLNEKLYDFFEKYFIPFLDDETRLKDGNQFRFYNKLQKIPLEDRQGVISFPFKLTNSHTTLSSSSPFSRTDYNYTDGNNKLLITIHHTTGDVTYDISDFRDKNIIKFADLELQQNLKFHFQDFFSFPCDTFDVPRRSLSTSSISSVNTISTSKSLSTLSGVMKQIGSICSKFKPQNDLKFIHCISSNYSLRHDEFSIRDVCNQIQCNGLPQLITTVQTTYSFVMTFKDIFIKFFPLISLKVPHLSIFRKKPHEATKPITKLFLESILGTCHNSATSFHTPCSPCSSHSSTSMPLENNVNEWNISSDKVFLTFRCHERLEALLFIIQSASSRKISKCWKLYNQTKPKRVDDVIVEKPHFIINRDVDLSTVVNSSGEGFGSAIRVTPSLSFASSCMTNDSLISNLSASSFMLRNLTSDDLRVLVDTTVLSFSESELNKNILIDDGFQHLTMNDHGLNPDCKEKTFFDDNNLKGAICIQTANVHQTLFDAKQQPFVLSGAQSPSAASMIHSSSISSPSNPDLSSVAPFLHVSPNIETENLIPVLNSTHKYSAAPLTIEEGEASPSRETHQVSLLQDEIVSHVSCTSNDTDFIELCPSFNQSRAPEGFLIDSSSLVTSKDTDVCHTINVEGNSFTSQASFSQECPSEKKKSKGTLDGPTFRPPLSPPISFARVPSKLLRRPSIEAAPASMTSFRAASTQRQPHSSASQTSGPTMKQHSSQYDSSVLNSNSRRVRTTGSNSVAVRKSMSTASSSSNSGFYNNNSHHSSNNLQNQGKKLLHTCSRLGGAMHRAHSIQSRDEHRSGSSGKRDRTPSLKNSSSQKRFINNNQYNRNAVELTTFERNPSTFDSAELGPQQISFGQLKESYFLLTGPNSMNDQMSNGTNIQQKHNFFQVSEDILHLSRHHNICNTMQSFERIKQNAPGDEWDNNAQLSRSHCYHPYFTGQNQLNILYAGENLDQPFFVNHLGLNSEKVLFQYPNDDINRISLEQNQFHSSNPDSVTPHAGIDSINQNQLASTLDFSIVDKALDGILEEIHCSEDSNALDCNQEELIETKWVLETMLKQGSNLELNPSIPSPYSSGMKYEHNKVNLFTTHGNDENDVIELPRLIRPPSSNRNGFSNLLKGPADIQQERHRVKTKDMISINEQKISMGSKNVSGEIKKPPILGGELMSASVSSFFKSLFEVPKKGENK